MVIGKVQKYPKKTKTAKQQLNNSQKLCRYAADIADRLWR